MVEVIDVSTAMERLARELMDKIESSAATSWCRDHGYNVKGTSYTEDKRNARADIERRINEADLEDDRARDSALWWYKAKADELDALREACRVIPEGVSWPRYEDGEPVRMGDPFVTWDGQASEVRSVTLYTPGPDAAWTINAGSYRNFVGGSDEAHRMHGLRLKRPAPKAIGADGVEVKPGDTVWLAENFRSMAGDYHFDPEFEGNVPICDLRTVYKGTDPMTVAYVVNERCVSLEPEPAWCPASWLTHTAPCLDKDGAPIDEGDTVWTEDGCRWKVLGIKEGGHPVQAKCVEGCHRGKRRDLKWTWVSHERPDSWWRLREDARKGYTAYWGCIGFCCDKCPALVDGKKPSERYGTAGCHMAKQLDLLARAERLAGVQGE